MSPDEEYSDLPPAPDWDDAPLPDEPESLSPYWDMLDDIPPISYSGAQAGGDEPDPGSAPAAAAATNENVGEDAMSEESFLGKSRAEEIAQKKLNRFMQRFFFWFTIVLVSVPVVVSSVGFTWLLVLDRMTDTIATAFFASVVGEVIGLSIIIGKYLFPNNGGVEDAPVKSKKRRKSKK